MKQLSCCCLSVKQLIGCCLSEMKQLIGCCLSVKQLLGCCLSVCEAVDRLLSGRSVKQFNRLLSVCLRSS